MRFGTKLHKGIEVPYFAVVKISPKGREYYLSGIDDNTALVKFIDNDEVFRMGLDYYNRHY